MSKKENKNFYLFLFFKKNGKTPLHDAALEGFEQIVNLLLERGANINVLDEVISKNEKRMKIQFLILFIFYF